MHRTVLYHEELFCPQCQQCQGWEPLSEKTAATQSCEICWEFSIFPKKRYLVQEDRPGQGMTEDVFLLFWVLNKQSSVHWSSIHPRETSPNSVLSKPCLLYQAPFKAEKLATCSQTHSGELFPSQNKQTKNKNSKFQDSMAAAGGQETGTIGKAVSFSCITLVCFFDKKPGMKGGRKLLQFTHLSHWKLNTICLVWGRECVFWKDRVEKQVVFQAAGMFSGGWIRTSPSARFTPCLPWAAMRKYSWKSPLILQWGQGSWLIYGAAHMASSEVTLHDTLSMRWSARVKVGVILRRNWDCDQTTPCRVFWRSHEQ